MWAVGVLAFELVAGKPPFGSGTDAETVKRILSTQVRLGKWGLFCRDVIEGFWQIKNTLLADGRSLCKKVVGPGPLRLLLLGPPAARRPGNGTCGARLSYKA